MRKIALAGAILSAFTGAAMSQERIVISSDWGEVTAKVADNEAGTAFLRTLPLTIEMQDHLRQEKTGHLPGPLPEGERQRNFSAGTLGVGSTRDFVIYYRGGRVPDPGIVILGQVEGDVSIFDRPGSVTVKVTRPD